HAAPCREGPARAAPYRFPGPGADTLRTMENASGPRRRRIGRIVAAVVGGLGWASVWQLLVGRPMELVIEGIKIDGPDDKSVFAAARLEATVEVHLRP